MLAFTAQVGMEEREQACLMRGVAIDDGEVDRSRGSITCRAPEIHRAGKHGFAKPPESDNDDVRSDRSCRMGCHPQLFQHGLGT